MCVALACATCTSYIFSDEHEKIDAISQNAQTHVEPIREQPLQNNTDSRSELDTAAIQSAETVVPILPNSEMPLPIKYEQLDIPGAEHALVERFREYYLSERALKWLHQVLEDGEQLRLYVRRKLKEQNMPSTLEYLPVVESNYSTTARSKSGATGLWQFMANSTHPYLMHTDFVDERLDPWRATEAALSKLQENFNIFHDWPLAIAAYNCGTGAMSRILAKNPGKDFWYLAANGLLRTETAQYVPKLLAIADVAENSAYYAVTLPSAKNENGNDTNPRAGYFDYVEVNGAISIKRLAHELRIDEDTLLWLNSALIKGITPPTGSWKIRVPEGMAQAARVALTAVEPYRFQTRYAISVGDSLWSIAKKFDTTVAALCEVNDIRENAILQIGKILYIPTK